MSNLMIKISGQITVAGTDPLLQQLPFGLTVELTTTQGQSAAGGWIGSGPVDNRSSTFEVFTAYNIGTSEQVNYFVYHENQLVQQGQVTVSGNATTIQLTAANYDDLFQPTDSNCLTISGNLSLGARQVVAGPVDPVQLKVYLYKAGFRTEELLATSVISPLGNYRFLVASEKLWVPSVLPQSEAEDVQIAEIFLVLKNGQTELLRSPNYSLEENTAIDLSVTNTAQYSLFKFEFDNLLSSITTASGIPSSQFYTITTDGDKPESSVLAVMTGWDEGLISTLVNAYKLNQATTIDASNAYALARVYGGNLDEWINLPASQITSIVQSAQAEHIIPSASAAATTAQKISDQAVDKTAAVSNEDNNDINTLFTAVITAQADVDTFVRLSLNADPNASVQQFWDTVNTQMGATKRVKLQQGMQLLGLTGMQPETTKHILTAIGTQPVRTFATKTLAEWTTIVNTVCSQSNKLCVPYSIRGNSTDPNNQQAKNEYAKRLYDLFTDTFSTVVMGNRISSGQVSPAVLSNPQQSAAFITANPDYDLRSNNIWNYDLSAGGYPVGVRNDLMKVQNILRVTEGKPDTVVQLLNAGIKSSADITAMSQPTFVATYAPLLGGTLTATAVYKKAAKVDMLTANLKTVIQPNNFLGGVFPKVLWDKLLKDPAPADAPNLETLFGSVDLCSCSECMSMYSPSAYFTDIMNFVQNRLGADLPFDELIRRRGDLQYIDLTCKNSNTAIPYIDLVNETLERVILSSISEPLPAESFQTTGSSKELDAYPEHTYREGTELLPYYGYRRVYNETLKTASYPNSLPMDLPLEESRTYFDHLGYGRYDLMQSFKPKTYTSAAATLDTISEYTALAELLGIPKLEADIISRTTDAALPAFLGAYYGFGSAETGWVDTLMTGNADSPGLNLLLERARITYKELLQLLNCDFLNKKVTISGELKRPFEIAAATTADPGTCNLDELRIVCNLTSGADTAKPLFFDKMHRFIRLRRATGWGYYQLDMVLNSFALTDFSLNAFKYVANVYAWSRQWRTTPESIAAFWGNISTTAYINFNSDSQDTLPSLYQGLFQNKSLVNPPDTNFGTPTAITGTYAANAGTILAGINILDTEYAQLLGFLGLADTATVTLAGLSRLYALVQFIKGNNLSVDVFLRLADLFDVTGTTIVGGSVSTLYALMQTLAGYISSFNAFIFNLEETEYLLENSDPSGQYIPAAETINIFFDSLRGELKKTVGDITVLDTLTVNILKNVILRAFSTNFGLEGDTTNYLLTDVVKIGAVSLLDYLSALSFINDTDPDDDASDAYLLLQKIAMVLNRFKLNKAEVELFFTRNTNLDVYNIASFPVTATTTTLAPLQLLMRFDDWVKVKGKLNLVPDEFIQLLRISSGQGTGGTGTGSKTSWKVFVQGITNWTSDELNILLGDTTVDGLVNILGMSYSTTTASNDFRRAALILQVAAIIEQCNIVGLSISAVYEALKADIIMEESWNVRNAAKAKHNEEQWLTIAKPLQDTLREKQRKAMVDYLVVRSGIFAPLNNYMGWKTENDLFAYFLIDVEMQPCMKTSRIKQAISSVQLFVDRIILNLEKDYSLNPSPQITIDTEMTAQWRSWRKWYRIWEANRKVFLYPENWIEPELRDNKTPFFKELETQLLQDEVKDNTVEDAFMAYLESLDEVARLEPVACYHEVETEKVNQQTVTTLDKVHVFGRTSSLPHRYFYRVLEDNEWSPWEKINADIKSDHITPVIWNRKLYLFWLTFQKRKPSENERGARSLYRVDGATTWQRLIRLGTDPRAGRFNPITVDLDGNAFNTWDITLNWTQFKDGKWLANELSAEKMVIDIHRAAFGSGTVVVNSYSNADTDRAIANWLTNNQEIDIDELFKNRLYLYAPFENVNNTDDGINFSVMLAGGLDETAVGIHAFKWRGSNSQDPVVMRVDDRGYQIMAPLGTRFNKMKFVEDPYQDGKLRRDNTVYSDDATLPNSYFSFSMNGMASTRTIVRSTNDSILEATPNGTFRVTARGSGDGNSHPHFQNPLTNMFLFEDQKNTFFARWEPRFTVQKLDTGVQLASDSSFAAAEAYSSDKYKVSLPTLMTATAPTYKGSALTGANTMYGYRFHMFYHAQIKEFIKAVNKGGIPALLKISNQTQDDSLQFETDYDPTTLVFGYPKNNVQFETRGAYSIYNWEIFFHAPMLIAQRLMDNQQFEEAQKWFHYIFNPTSNTRMDGLYSGHIKRFWKFYPFYKESETPTETLTDLLEAIHDGYLSVLDQVDKWEKNPFNPHLIARMRVLAYMKNVFMKYLDNLIAWGDQLFRRDTIESINEATQLYILASNLLGPRPQEIPARAKAAVMNYEELEAAGLGALSDSLVSIESYFAPSTDDLTDMETEESPITGKMFYFCLPKNDKLAAYWDTVADRLFKIRNCMDIDGSVRQLPLYEPPIDPALLVRAAAMGIDINSILDTVSGANMPYYRFSYMLQKANEFCADVRGLGSSLLSALEKKDAEELSLIRSGQELNLLEKIKLIKEQQVSEAEANLESSRLAKQNTELRYQYYSSRPFKNAGEEQYLRSIQTGLVLQAAQGAMEATVSIISNMPTIHLQGLASGASTGGFNIANALKGTSATIGIAASINNAKGSMASTLAGYERRRDDWNFQANTAQKELEQMDQQILAAEIRLDIAKKELSNQELQIENARETDTYMRNKFTNKELYSWMVSQVSATYFQSYQLAYDLAKQAESCYNYELPVAKKPAAGFIKFGYWDSLRKGLMAGEKLQFDLRTLDSAYMEENKREFELTKSFSLALTNPAALVSLINDGTCGFALDDIWYNLDFPGHYLRKIKSVSISIPCVAGPYTTVAAQLSLGSNSIQRLPLGGFDSVNNTVTTAIATSSAQNDSGIFELNFRDERYIPFEGAGAVSNWTLKMMAEKGLRQFDYSTISDVIIHVKYTARDSDLKATQVITNLKTSLGISSTGIDLPRYYSVKHEFSADWVNGFSQVVPVSGTSYNGHSFTVKINRDQFPAYAEGKTITISKMECRLFPTFSNPAPVFKLKYGSATPVSVVGTAMGSVAFSPAKTLAPTADETEITFTLYKEVTGEVLAASDVEEFMMILTYKLS